MNLSQSLQGTSSWLQTLAESQKTRIWNQVLNSSHDSKSLEQRKPFSTTRLFLHTVPFQR